MKILRMSEEKLRKEGKKLNEKAQEQLNKMSKEFYRLIQLEQSYRKFTFCHKCERFSHLIKDNGSYSLEIHKEINFCSHNVSISCVIRSILQSFVDQNRESEDIDRTLFDICEESIRDLTEFVDSLETCTEV